MRYDRLGTGSSLMMDNHFTRQYIPEDSSEHHTRRRENLKSHTAILMFFIPCSFYYVLSAHYQQLSLGYIVYINQTRFNP
jgi:hypothetical protein